MITKQDDTPGVNKSIKRIVPLRAPKFPNVDDMVKQVWMNTPRPENAVDVLLVNPPSPDSELWNRPKHRVGHRGKRNIVWPQVSLAQMAALLVPTYSVKVIDASAEGMGWSGFITLLEQYQPRYYITHATVPTLENDMIGCFLAKTRGAKTIVFGTHLTPIPRETLRTFPNLDFLLVGEPDLTLRDLLDHLEGKVGIRPPNIVELFKAHDPTYPPPSGGGRLTLHEIKGLAWCDGDKIVVNPPRPFVRELDDLPVPLHELLPLQKYRMPLVNGPFATIVTSRGCPAGCTFCIKHIAYQYNFRMRSPKMIMDEMWHLKSLGISNVRMYSDLFTADRDQVMELCERMIEEKINIKWMCNSRVDFVDEEMLALMWKAGCWLITWEIESADEQILKHVHMGTSPKEVERAILWSKKTGIMNWGYFILGLPGETEESINETIRFAKKLPLDIALFHVAVPYPGTPFFFEVVDKGWFRPGTRWGQVNIDQGTVLEYPGLTAERIVYWQKRAYREWAFRPQPLLTYLKMLTSDFSTFQSAVSVGLQNLSWSAKT